MKRFYDRELDELIATFSGEAPKLLLHSCCGPCSTYVLEYLTQHFNIYLYFDNSNIDTEEEFEKRFLALSKTVEQVKSHHTIMLLKNNYDQQKFAKVIAGVEHLGEGSIRCFRCYAMRLKAAAEKGKELGCDYFASTLSISPHKNVGKINDIGETVARSVGINHLPNDFKKKGGYQRSVELSKTWQIYRQSYCGCRYSKMEAIQREQKKKR